MTIDEIIKYVMHTPNNPNKKVLKDMLESLVEENKGSDDDDIIYDGGNVSGWD